MLFQLKTKWLRYSQYEILDEKGEPVYLVKGKFWKLGHNLEFSKADGTQIGSIRSGSLPQLNREYEIFLGEKRFATFKRTDSWFKPILKSNFQLEIPGKEPYSINGSFLNHEYSFERKDRTMATVSRKFFTLAETYGVEIEKGEDDVAILTSVIAIDLCRRAGKGS